jgi:hypothetical protein
MKLSAQEKCKLAGLLARHQTPDPDAVGARPRHALPGLPEGSSLSPFSCFFTHFCYTYGRKYYMYYEGGFPMSTISLRVSDEENKLIQNYVAANNLNLSSFIRSLVLDKIEEDMKLDEDRILRARALLKKEKTYDHTEVWKELGI